MSGNPFDIFTGESGRHGLAAVAQSGNLSLSKLPYQYFRQ